MSKNCCLQKAISIVPVLISLLLFIQVSALKANETEGPVKIDNGSLKLELNRAGMFCPAEICSPDGEILLEAVVPDKRDTKFAKSESIPFRGGMEYHSYFSNAYSDIEKSVWVYDAKPYIKLSAKITCTDPVKGKKWQMPFIFKVPENCKLFIRGVGNKAFSSKISEVSKLYGAGRWVAFAEENGEEGIMIIFPPARNRVDFLPGRRHLMLADNSWRFSDGLFKGAVLRAECWIAPFKGRDYAKIAGKLIKEISEQGKNMPSEKTDTSFILTENARCMVWSELTGKLILPASSPADTKKDCLTVFAARRDIEGIQIAVKMKNSAEKLNVAVPELKNRENGSVFSTENIEIMYEGFFNVVKVSEKHMEDPILRHGLEKRAKDSAILNNLFVAEAVDYEKSNLLHRYFYGKPTILGETPDYLYKADNVEARRNRNVPVYIKFKVPENQKAGIYSGEINIRNGEKILAQIPLKLKVWNFSLPGMSSLALYSIWGSVKPENRMNYYRFMAQNKIGIWGYPRKYFPAVSLDKEGEMKVDFTPFDKLMDVLINEYNMSAMKLPHGQIGGGHSLGRPFCGFKPRSEAYYKSYREYMKKLNQHLREKGWEKRFACYIFDEPLLDQIDCIKECSKIFHEEIPWLKVYSASTHVSSLYDAVDCFCMPIPYYFKPEMRFNFVTEKGRKEIEMARKAGKELWWYGWPAGGIGMSPFPLRALAWLSWKYGFKKHICYALKRSPVIYFHQPMGWAYMLYCGKNGMPVETLQWRQLCEGIEDYEMLKILEKEIDLIKSKKSLPAKSGELLRAEKLMDEAKALFPLENDMPEFSPPEHKLADLRIRIGNTIEKLKKITKEKENK